MKGFDSFIRLSTPWRRSPELEDPSQRFCGSYRLHSLDEKPIARRSIRQEIPQ
jgi:hypothetical protein